MSTQADYTPEEWQLILNGPFVAGAIVIAADPSIFGSIKEMAAIIKTVTKYAGQSSSGVIQAIAVALQNKQKPDVPQNKHESKETAVASWYDLCRQAAATVEMKSADEAADYRRLLVTIAQNTAEASKEGGFLGIGAVRVSEDEAAAVQKLADELGVAI